MLHDDEFGWGGGGGGGGGKGVVVTALSDSMFLIRSFLLDQCIDL